MNQLVLINPAENAPIRAGEMDILNKLSRKAHSLAEGVKKFMESPFRGTSKETPVKAYEIVPLAECERIVADAVPVSSSNLNNYEKLRENICIESKLKEMVGSLNAAIAANFNQFEINETERHFVSANKKALKVVLKNLLYFINEKNHHQQVQIEVFEDFDYTVVVARHKGMRLMRSELMKIYQSPPAQIKDLGNNLLGTCWHLLKATGGWLTSGDKDGVNYISIGLPK